jgi:hypothetical protein
MEKRLNLVNILSNKNPSDLKMVLGFDGFVDEIIHVVDKRMDADTFRRIETIDQLAERIQKASGLSTNIELVSTLQKIGGNGPIMANALATNHPQITYIGSLGYPNVDTVFAPMNDKMKLISIAGNGHTDALEFHDGKLMLGKMTSLKNVTYERLMEVISEQEFIQLLEEADLFAAVNWSMLPNMTDMLKKIITNILPKLHKREHRPYFFIDLADPEKREEKEIKEMLYLLKEFSSYFFVVLGLNKKEAYDVAGVLQLFDHESLSNMQISLEDLNMALYENLKIDSVVIHPVDRSCCVVNNQYYEESGPYIAKPKLSTGAGDNFNAGFMLGLLLGVKPDEALLCGMGTSGFYVRNAYSPNFKELQDFIVDWAKGRIE